MDDLPSCFDTIVVGTGLPESILAAAHARNGRSVLHIDKFESYGGMWSTFNFEGLESWLLRSENPDEPSSEYDRTTDILPTETEKLFDCVYNDKVYTNFKKYEYFSDEPTDSKSASGRCCNIDRLSEQKAEMEQHMTDVPAAEVPETVATKKDELDVVSIMEEVFSKTLTPTPDTNWSMAKIRSLYRKFNIDLAPKMLFSRGELVDLLISSNIARYSEFKSVTRVLTYLDGKLEQVPCSRSDVFTTRNVSIVEKRMLMKLLNFCLAYEENSEEYQGFERKTFVEFLKSRKLTPNVQHFVLHAIAMLPESGSTLEGLKSTKRFLTSLGRYGNTPFLWPLFGSGELPQCFCRLCAVFGGIYYLKRGVDSVIVDQDNKCSGIISNGRRFSCKWLVMDAHAAPISWIPDDTGKSYISRAILITTQSILPLEKEQLTLLRLPGKDGLKEPTWVIELGSNSMACPPGLFVVHLTCKSTDDAETDLDPAVSLLFDRSKPESKEDSCDHLEKPRVLWCLYFNQLDNSECDFQSNAKCPSNVTLIAGPGGFIDFDDAVLRAKTAFLDSFPEEEFLPRAPDPEEIIIEGSEGTPATLQSTDDPASPESDGGESGDASTTIVESASRPDLPTQTSCDELDSSVPKEE